MTRRFLMVAAAAMTVVAAEAGAQDAAAGEDLYRDSCRQCHGPTGRGMASYPRLNDKEAEYLVDRLQRYRAGERFGPNSALMIPAASDLSDEDIANLAAFLSVKE